MAGTFQANQGALGDFMSNTGFMIGNSQSALPASSGFNFGDFNLDSVGGITGALGIGLNAFNAYNAYKANKLAQQIEREKLALQRANFAQTANALNTKYRDQMSGRGYVSMDSQAKQDLGQEYQSRKLATSY